MKGRLKFFYVALICLPALLITVAGGWFVVGWTPRAAHGEVVRIGREYRERAEELMEKPEAAGYAGSKKKGWVQRGKIGGVPWGYAVEGERATVWVSTGDKECRAVETAALKPFPYAPVVYAGSAVIAAALAWLSALASLWFLRFVRERDDFLAATAHDLTTPLVGMRLMIGRDDAEAKRLNERMLLIVNNIKDFLRRGGRRRPPQPVRFDLSAACREAYRLFAADYEDSYGGAVDFNTPAAYVFADEVMTMQILWNLFGNALKYAAPYGAVRVAAFSDGAAASVSFADEGGGMTPVQMRRAFDRYYRAKTALQSGKGGFGIGLCTARDFARAMGGDVTVRPNRPKGCVFTLTLPAADSEASEAEDNEQ
ncbi:MAG: HAMP domain-containing histidine kinase [Kiritimatiellae bacterium]|nr:HAMP domain-containing histidine kinase [Kiritimatiellia bacterium]